MRPIRTILQPTDFSAKAERAFELACGLARVLDARLIVFHAAADPLLPWSRSSRNLDYCRRPWREAQERLDAIVADDLEIQHLLVPGEPTAEIIRAAHELDPGLIVIGAPRRTSWRWFLGPSVAEAIIFEAPCPVLTTGEFSMATAPQRDRWNRSLGN
ncbi:MAG TPA: universal stress protein [Terriglobales bacterium]|nr:universal stress protein [Terriglobales bacterium]